MRRDMEFCIQLLKDFSENEFQSSFKLRNEADEKYLYHMNIMYDAGLIDYHLLRFSGGCGLKNCPRLTWAGNDFIDLIENETIWSKTKEAAKDKGAELLKLPLDVMLAYLKQQATQLLGIDN